MVPLFLERFTVEKEKTRSGGTAPPDRNQAGKMLCGPAGAAGYFFHLPGWSMRSGASTSSS